MIDLLHTYHASLLDDHRAAEAEEDLRDAVVEETGRLHFDTCPIEELLDMAAWLCSQAELEGQIEEHADSFVDEHELSEMEQAFTRRIFDHLNDLREELPAAAAE